MKPGSRKHHGHGLARRFQRLLLQLALQAQGDLRNLPRHPHRAVHALRTRMKKIPAILRLVESRIPAAARREILAIARRLRKSLAPLRDAQVAAALGFPIAKSGRVRRRGGAPLSQEAARLVHLLEAASLEGLERDDVRLAYIDTYRIGRRRMKECLESPEAARLHAWRKPVKELYYQSLALHGAPGMKKRIRRARKLGRWLGQDHDWQLVLEHHPKEASRIAPERERLRRRLFRIAGRLYAPRPRRLREKLR